MNVQAWQSQQRALKDEEKKRQKEAAEALQNFRGGVSEEDSKLAAFKEEERNKKLEAGRALQNFRGGVSEEDTKFVALREEERQQKLEAERRLRDYRGSAPDKTKQIEEKKEMNYPELVGHNQDNSIHNIAPGAVSALAGKFNTTNEENTVLSSGATSGVPQMASDNDVNGPTENKTEGINSQLESLDPTQTVSSSPGRMHVKFTFGLTSFGDSPSYEGYLMSVSKIVNDILDGDPGMADYVSFEPPVVNNVQRDGRLRMGFVRFVCWMLLTAYCSPYRSSLLSRHVYGPGRS
jgi:hypothetical protein